MLSSVNTEYCIIVSARFRDCLAEMFSQTLFIGNTYPIEIAKNGSKTSRNLAQGHPTPGSGIITAYGSDSEPEDEDEQPDYLPGSDHAVPPPMVVEQGISAWSQEVESMLNNVAAEATDAREGSMAPSPHGAF